MNCFERANLPTITPSERLAILTFAVIGAGPTGVEFASELLDFLSTDGARYWPELVKEAKIIIIEASGTVLAPFAKELQDAAIEQLTQTTERTREIGLPPIQLALGSPVREVTAMSVRLENGTDVPYGMAVWAAGNGPLPITTQIVEALGQDGSLTRGRIAVDPFLRAIGAEGVGAEGVYALGDCAAVVANDLPATAQVAAQQGEYLARNMEEGEAAPQFQFLNLGILACKLCQRRS